MQLSDKGEQVLMKVKDVWLQTFNGFIERLRKGEPITGGIVGKGGVLYEQQHDRLKQTS